MTAKRIPLIPDRPWAFIRYVIRHLPARIRWLMVATMACGILTVGSELGITWVLSRIVATIVGDRALLWPRIMPWLVLLLLVSLARNVVQRSWDWMERRVMADYPNMVRNLLFARLLQQSHAFLHNNFAGVLANHVRRAGEVMATLFERMQNSFIPLVMRFVGTGILLYSLTPWLTLFLLLFVALSVAGSLWQAPKWSRLSEASAAASSKMSGYIVDSATNLAAVQQNAAWAIEQRNMQLVQDNVTAAWRKRMVYLSWFYGTFDIITTIFYVGFMALVAYGWQQGDVDAGQLTLAAALAGQLFTALSSTVSLLTVKMDDIGVLRDSLVKISQPLSVLDRDDAAPLQVTRGDIVFDNISFAYQDGQAVFAGLTLAIAPGQRVGLVGVSGAGKTTLGQLLLRAYDPTGGRVCIDGQDIATITQDSLHRAVAVIPQEPLLFHRTLAENIAYGQPDAPIDMARVRMAAAAAQATRFIDSLLQGYDTLVGERGVKLSGGQRQRVAIARAIYKNAPILLLDEATSALDSETEKDIQAAMLQAMEGRTTLVVAHRLSTISHLDRIVVMEAGRIVEDGTCDSLMAGSGIFARLWNLQAGGFIANHL